MFYRLFFVLALFSCFSNIYAADISKIRASETTYVVRLTNGDVLTGNVEETFSDETRGSGLKLKTMIGLTAIFEKEIYSIKPVDEAYRHGHRAYIMPTALPIGDDHFIGDFEIVFLYAGFGIGDYLSVTGGRSSIPTINPDQQCSVLNLKGTFYNERFDDASIVLAGGLNFTWINDANKLTNYYAVATYSGDKSNLSAAIYYKAGAKDLTTLNFNKETYDLKYPNGSFGIGLSLDTKFSNRNDLRFIGEVWNSDVNRPTNTAILLGLRLHGDKFSSDFGLAFSTQPFAAPFISFVWTPFK